MDHKDRTIYILTMLVMMQFIFSAITVAWHYQVVDEIKEDSEYTHGLALDAYNYAIGVENDYIDLSREIDDIKDRVPLFDVGDRVQTNYLWDYGYNSGTVAGHNYDQYLVYNESEGTFIMYDEMYLEELAE